MKAQAVCAIGLVGLVACGPGDEDENLGERSDAVKVCPDGPTVEGIDTSHYQPNTDWTQVKGAGREFAIIKATEGTTYTDPTFAKDWPAIKAAGIIRGAYHWFHPADDPIAQANFFLGTVGPLDPDDLPLMIDFEDNDGLGGGTVGPKALQFLQALEDATGKKPLVYTGPNFFENVLGNPPGFGGYPLVIAHYGTDCPEVPPEWQKWQFHQYTSTGTVPGVQGNVDHDVWNGTLEQLKAFVGGKPTPSAQVTGNDFITVANWANDGHVELFVSGTSDHLLHAVSEKGKPEWGALDDLGAGAACGIAASFWPAPVQRADVFAPTADGATAHRYWDGTMWTEFADFGGKDLAHLSSLVWPDGHVEVFGLGADGAIWHTFSQPNADDWSEWGALGAGETFVTGAAAILGTDGHAELFATDDAGTAWRNWSGDFPDGWHGWEELGGKVGSRPIPVRWSDGHFEIFARSSAGGLVHATSTMDGFSAFEAIGGETEIEGEPSAIVNPGAVGTAGAEVVARGKSGEVLHLWWLGDQYGEWSPHLGQTTDSDPFLWIRPDGRTEIFAVDPDGKLVHSHHAPEGWNAWTPIAGGEVSACVDLDGPGSGGAGSGAGAGSGTGGAGPLGAEGKGEVDAGCSCRTAPVSSRTPALVALLTAVPFLRRRRKALH